MMADKTVKKLYLCDGCACGVEAPKWCYLNDGMCCHTTNYDFSALKNLGKLIPKTKWILFGDDLMVQQIPQETILKKLVG